MKDCNKIPPAILTHDMLKRAFLGVCPRSDENSAKIEELHGKTLIGIFGAKEESDEIYFVCSDGTVFKLYHEQECCEDVLVEDITGVPERLLNTPITLAEDISSTFEDPYPEADGFWDDSHTWTWYKLATIKGYVTIRWYGESNGYYSEGVDMVKMTAGEITERLNRW